MARYVDLDAVIETLELEYGYEGMREDLYALPTIEVEPVRHGRWKYRKLDFPRDGVMHEMYCTSCGKTPDPQKYYNRCPECGAKMDKEDDNG